MLKWPDAQAVDHAVRRWAEDTAREHPELVRIGYIGSYARGDWGVGSDVDLVVVVSRSEVPDLRRAAEFDATDLPVPADVLVYTLSEWDAIETTSRFYQTVQREAVWVYPPPPTSPA